MNLPEFEDSKTMQQLTLIVSAASSIIAGWNYYVLFQMNRSIENFDNSLTVNVPRVEMLILTALLYITIASILMLPAINYYLINKYEEGVAKFIYFLCSIVVVLSVITTIFQTFLRIYHF